MKTWLAACSVERLRCQGPQNSWTLLYLLLQIWADFWNKIKRSKDYNAKAKETKWEKKNKQINKQQQNTDN